MIICENMLELYYDRCNVCIIDEEGRRCVEVPGNVCRAELFINGEEVRSKFVESYTIVTKGGISSGKD